VAERMYGVASVYSDDHGRTWQSTGAVPVSVDYPINEARLVQRDDGTVLINGRYAAGGNRQRITSVSKDRGLTWSAPTMDGGTGTFNAVDAGMLGYTRGRILFSRPDAPVRYNMTVSISYDDAQTFRYSRVINPNRSYYSDLARLSDGTIVLIYGCDGDIASFPLRVNVCRFNLEWLTQGRDSLAKGPRLKTKSYKLEGDRLEYHVTAPGPGRVRALAALLPIYRRRTGLGDGGWPETTEPPHRHDIRDRQRVRRTPAGHCATQRWTARGEVRTGRCRAWWRPEHLA